MCDEQTKAGLRWDADKGDQTLSLQYPLSDKSICLDIGAYTGEYAVRLANQYNCRVFCFEPIREYFYTLVEATERFDNIKPFNFGIGVSDGYATISVEGNRSSVYRTASTTERIAIRGIDAVLADIGVSHIDFLKMNIEGMEYDLLEHIIATSLIKRISIIQIQFHSFVPNAYERRIRIREELAATHTCLYEYPFVWEAWRLK